MTTGTGLRHRISPSTAGSNVQTSKSEREKNEKSASTAVEQKPKNTTQKKIVGKTEDVVWISPRQWHWISRIVMLCFYGFWFVFGLLVLRKTQNAIAAVRYVKSHGDSVAIRLIENSPEFEDLIHTLDTEFTRPPAILLLNQYALNMTYNFLCNTATLDGVHERLIFVTLDTVARDELKKAWPQIRQFHWPTPSLYKPFSFAEGPYQTIYLLRSNLAVALLRRGKSFWMMQQDTFWRRNLFELGYEDDMSYDAIFDQIGIDENSMRAEWVNGANFFIRANNDTLEFFERLSDKLAHWYTPDMGVMIHQCHTWEKPRCAFIPHKIAHSWEWMYTAQENPPYIIQLDCETDGGSKLMQLGRFGFHFTDNNGTCNFQKVEQARKRMEQGKVDVSYTNVRFFPSWGRLQFKAYWMIVDYILMTPIIGPFLKPYLPLVGYILMITMLNLNDHYISRQYTPTRVEKEFFEVPIKVYKDGQLSAQVRHWQVGDMIECRGPYTEEEDWKNASHLLIAAAGTGIAPFVRIVDHLLSEDNSNSALRRICLLYCVRTVDDVIFANQLTEWAQSWNARVTLVLSKHAPDEMAPKNLPYLVKFEAGRLSQEIMEKHLKQLRTSDENITVAVCGPTTFEKDAINFAIKAGVMTIIRFHS